MQDCEIHAERVYYRDRLYISPNEELKLHIIYRTHSTGPGGHPGRIKILDLLNRFYWWPRIAEDVKQFVRACQLCTRTKSPRSSPPGFIKPLSVPFRAWSDISVSYITPLPLCTRNGTEYRYILVTICRLTKMRHFIPVLDLNVRFLADAFIQRIYCLYGTLDNIVSDRGSQFISEFWHQLSNRLGISLKHSSVFYLETDGQTERVNVGVEQYLRQFMNFRQDDWAD
jgi:hypothetical protein